MERKIVGSQKNAGSILTEVKFKIRTDNKQQLIDILGLMTSIGNIYCFKHVIDGAIRDFDYSDYDPNKMSKTAKLILEEIRNGSRTSYQNSK